MKNYKYILIWIAICLLGIFSCSEMNDLHDEYLREGETLYVGQPDSAHVFPGENRVKIRYWINDPKAAKMKVFWNFKQDSILFEIPSNSLGKPIDVYVDNIEDKLHTLELVTYNKEMKYPSIPLSVQTMVYGDIFRESLTDRNIRYTTSTNSESVEIHWLGDIENSIGTKLVYTATNDESKTIIVPMSDIQTNISDYKSDLKYQTIFLPEENAIDTFYTEIKELTEIDKLLDKSLYKRWVPSDMTYNSHGFGPLLEIESIWDNDINTKYVFRIPDKKLPLSIPFDLGQVAKVTRIRHWQRQEHSVAYRAQNAKKFVIWGTDSADILGNSYDGWIKLGICEIYKPSGLPLGQESAEDLAYAAKGEVFLLDKTAPPVRYIRYEVIETFDNGTAGAIGEISFFHIEE